ncbi:MAG: DUF6473 family protein, partial [Shimia sp.]
MGGEKEHRVADARTIAVLGGGDRRGARCPPEVTDLRIRNAGPDACFHFTQVIPTAQARDIVMIDLPSGANTSNAFFRVHPRRNDRIIDIRPRLRAELPGAEWIDVHFTGHLLQMLEHLDHEVRDAVIANLREAWMVRMSALVRCFRSPVVLVWRCADATCCDAGRCVVTPDMVAHLARLTAGCIRTGERVQGAAWPGLAQEALTRAGRGRTPPPSRGRRVRFGLLRPASRSVPARP